MYKNTSTTPPGYPPQDKIKKSKDLGSLLFWEFFMVD